MRISRLVLFGFLVLLLAAGSLLAQGAGTTSSLSGNVTTDGKPLPGVTVTISSPALQGTRTAVTGEAGGYNFPSLPPGLYTVNFDLEGMAKISKKTQLTLAQDSHVDAEMRMSGVSEAITVTASAPAVLETTEVSRNFSQKQISELPVRRNVRDTVLLAPGVNSNGPNNQISISGAPSFDNLFLVNGVVVNENLRGQPHNLFIEDAIQETTILTGAISAEYGRFTGGVVSTLTKSGGNEFSGSLRDSFSNPKWVAKSDFRDGSGTREADHPNTTANVYEGTLGGYLMKDRLWFFGAGRHTNNAPAPANGNPLVSTLTTNIPFLNTLAENRYEGKLTAQVTPKHNVVASYLNVKTTEHNNFFAPIYDTASIVAARQLPNSLKAIAYNGVLTTNTLLEGQVSQKKFAFIHSGGLFTDPIRGTWISDTNARFNAPVFCGVCTNEERNNDSASLKGSYYLNTKSLGTHNLAVGGELYKETRLVNNNQSASNFTISSTGTAVFYPGDLTPYPRFDNNTLINYRPILVNSTGSHLNTKSVFTNDKWDLNSHWSFNIGVRYDKNHALDASNNLVSEDSAFSPRLGAIFDFKGDGRSKFNVSYARYTTKIVDGNVGGAGNAAGTPALFRWRYAGPVVDPANKIAPQDALKILFDWFNTRPACGNNPCGVNYFGDLNASNIPGFTQRILDPIVSPYVNEISLGWGQQVGRTGYVRVDGIDRKWKNFYGLELDSNTVAQIGTVTSPPPANTKNDVAVLVNDNSIKRHYQGAQLTFGWHPTKWNIGGGYTFAKLRGSDTTESDGSASSPIAPLAIYYPEFLGYAQRIPEGYLYGDQRHRGKLWAGYDFTLPLGTLNASVIQSADSGRAYSAVGSIDISQNPAVTTLPAYTKSQLGTSADYFFSNRGAFRTPSVFSTDLALNYTVPVFGRAQVFLQGQVLNVFNNSKIASIVNGQLNTTVLTSRSGVRIADPANPTKQVNPFATFNPWTQTPVECPQSASWQQCYAMGANWQLANVRSANNDVVNVFGTALSKDAFQTPRTYRVAVGVRF
jgi:outer membrane receptor protein involved in Fe transport